MAQMIGRNLIRTMILILAAGLVIGVIYVLSFTSMGATVPGRGEFLGQRSGEGQLPPAPEGGEFQPPESEGGQGFGRNLGEGRGHGGEEFSLVLGLAEFIKGLFVTTLLIIIVSFLQRLAKRKQRVSPAA